MKIITKTELFGGFILSVLNCPEELGRGNQYLNTRSEIVQNPHIIDSNDKCIKIMKKIK